MPNAIDPVTFDELNTLKGIDISTTIQAQLDAASGGGVLTNTHIYVGNASNVATDVAMSGDATMANTGAITVTKTHLSINTQTDSYTLVLGDDGKLIIMNKGSANNLTIPLNASVAFPVGTQIAVQQLGAGQTTIVATGGVTTQAQPGLKISARYGLATLIKVATDTWIVAGALSA